MKEGANRRRTPEDPEAHSWTVINSMTSHDGSRVGISRRSALKAAGGGLLAAVGLGGPTAARAQVTQSQCGNMVCAANPGVCKPGCVCCVFPNGNSRCRPPDQCTAPGTAATTTTTTTTAAPCAGVADGVACATGKVCLGGVCTGNGACEFGAPTGCGDVVNGCGGEICGGEESGCSTTVEGGAVCTVFNAVVTAECETSANCAEGEICTPTCIGTRCATVCGG